jgi:hypothetical protein
MLRALGIALVAAAILATPVVPAHADTDDTHLVGKFVAYYSDPYGLYYGGLEVAGIWEGGPGTETDYSCYPTEPVTVVGAGQYDATLRCEWGYESYHVIFGVPDVLTMAVSFRSDGKQWSMAGTVDGQHPLDCSGLVNPLLSSDDPDFPDYRADGTCEIT